MEYKNFRPVTGGIPSQGATLGGIFPYEDVPSENRCSWRSPSGIAPTVETSVAPAPQPTIPWPDPLAEAAYHGLAGEIVHAIEPQSEADSAALLVQTLVAFGNFVGRGPHAVVERDYHYTNLFAVLVGETSKARKGTSLGRVLDLFKRVEPPLGGTVDLDSWAGTRVLSGLSSGEGLIWQVRDPIYKFEKLKKGGEPQEVMSDPGVGDKRLLVVEPEFGRVLKVMSREGSTLSSLVRTAWDWGNLRSMTKNSAAVATNAHISILGHITGEELRAALESTDAANGFANRFVFLCVRRSKCLPEGGRDLEADTLDTFAGKIRDAAEIARTIGEVVRDQDARAKWAEVYEDLSDGHPGLYGAVTGRAEAQVLRLSVLYAIFDGSREVRLSHLEAALALWEYCAASARWIFGVVLGDTTADVILAALRESAPQGRDRTQISALLGHHAPAAEIERALGVLLNRGLARREFVETPGRKKEIWSLQ